MNFAGCEFYNWKKFEFGFRRKVISENKYPLISMYILSDENDNIICKIRLQGHNISDDSRDSIEKEINDSLINNIEENKKICDMILLKYNKLLAFL